MDNQMLPAHEFFIYVQPARTASDGLSSSSSDEQEQDETLAGPADLSSWTRIDLVDTIAVYARLIEEPAKQTLKP